MAPTKTLLCVRVRAMTFYMLMIDIDSLAADFDTNKLLTLLGHYVCFPKKKRKRKKKKERKKEKNKK